MEKTQVYAIEATTITRRRGMRLEEAHNYRLCATSPEHAKTKLCNAIKNIENIEKIEEAI